MNSVGNWAMGLCAAGVACAVLDMLTPAGGLKRVCHMLTAVFFFCCLIGPFGEVVNACYTWFEADTASSQTTVDQTLDDTVVKQVEELLESAMKADASSRVQEEGLTVKKVDFERDMSRADSIYMKCVRVIFAKEDEPISATVVKELERAWGTSVEVYYSDGE